MLGLSNACSSSSYIPFSTTKSILLNGTDEYLDTGATFQSTWRGDFSISMWVRPTDGTPDSTVHLFGIYESPNVDEMYLELSTDGKLKFYFEANNDSVNVEIDAAVFSDGLPTFWKHIVVVCASDESTPANNSVFTIYVDGIIPDQTTTNHVTGTNQQLFATSDNLFIGARNNDGTAEDFLSGGIDEFAIWSRTLSAAAIGDLYNDKNPTDLKTTEPGYLAADINSLVSWYRMGDGAFDNISVVHDQVNPGFGSDLVTNGTFDADSDWNGDESISGGQLTKTSGSLVYQSGVVTEGKVYAITVDVETVGAPNQIYAGGGSSGNLVAGVQTVYVTAGSSNNYIGFNNGDTSTVYNSIIVKQLNGNPALVIGGVTSFSDDFSDSFA